MIHLERTERPAELTDEKQQELTEEYIKDNSKQVWNKVFIRKGLLELSHGKCCYCERRVGPGVTDMHIDHFRPKSLYPREVVSWNNLLPSCGDCNRSKSDHDTVKQPIVNPCDDDPKEYFYLKDYRYKSFDTDLDSKGNMTIEVLDLNDLNKKCYVRYRVASGILDKLNQLNQDLKNNADKLSKDVRKRNRAIRTCRDLLCMCIPTAEFSAFTATALQNDQDYIEIKQILKQANIWNEELEMLDLQSQKCVFETSRKNA